MIQKVKFLSTPSEDSLQEKKNRPSYDVTNLVIRPWILSWSIWLISKSEFYFNMILIINAAINRVYFQRDDWLKYPLIAAFN